MSPYLYAFLCVLVPLAWGLLVAAGSTLLEKRLGRKPNADAEPIAQDDRV